MQRFHGPSVTSAVNNNTVGGTSIRDTVRTDSSSVSTNFQLNARRTSQITPYKLKCDKDPLNSRLGPPDFNPQTPNCPEETLTREYAQSGYRDMVEGLEEAREISLSQVQTFTKPVILKCKEAIRKRLRAINESRAQKRKAGQVYGVPLAGSLLSKPGIFPDQKPCSEDYRRRWIEGLSQPHKRLRTLASQIPHGYRKKALFEVLVKNNVPLLRATWFIKVNYLNQVRPGAFSTSGTPDKTQLSRSELWTKDIIDYLQYILDELFSRVSSRSASHGRERSAIMYAAPAHHKGDQAAVEGNSPSLHFKWSYVVRLLQWHHSEGLILPSLIIDWALGQLEGKEWVEIFQLLLPVIYSLIEVIILSQTYVRNLVGAVFRFMKEPLPAGSDLVDNSRRAYATTALTELLRYLIVAVPETFVAFDCFPLPQFVLANDVAFLPRPSDDSQKKNLFPETAFKDKRLDSHYWSSLNHIVASIQAQSDSLAKAASPGYPGYGAAKAVQALDKALIHGDIRGAYKFLFEEDYDGVADQTWMLEVSPCLQSALKWIGTASLSLICSVFFLCEWATCEFRDFRNARLPNLKFTGRKDFCHVYIAVRLLKMKLKGLQDLAESKRDGNTESGFHSSGFGRQFNTSNKALSDIGSDMNNVGKGPDGGVTEILNVFESPGPLHDIIVCWIDQHEAHGGGSKRVHFLLTELAKSGIFHPPAYVRQLIVSGYTDANGPLLDKRKRHRRVLKQLPAPFMRDILEESVAANELLTQEMMHVYSSERLLVLRGLVSNESRKSGTMSSEQKFHFKSNKKHKPPPSGFGSVHGISIKSSSTVSDLKAAISSLFQFPQSSSTSADAVSNEPHTNLKKFMGLNGNIIYKTDQEEETLGCEECRKAKRQKLGDERGSSMQVDSPSFSDDEDSWWVKKGTKTVDMFNVEPPAKQMKQTSRVRPKGICKMQSLSQLASARIEGSQGASTSHMCDSRVSCPHHKSDLEGEIVKTAEATKTIQGGDIVSIGNNLKELSFIEKRTITTWLISTVRQFVEEMEKKIKANQFNRPYPGDEKNSSRWKLGEDELSCILYLLDISSDLVSATHFLIWMLPKVPCSVNPATHTGRNVLLMQRNMENHICEVGEACLLSSIRRYEHIFSATDRIPQILSACMHRTASVLSSTGRISSQSALYYTRYLLKKYGSLPSVTEWEKCFKASCDKRLLSELESGRALDGEYRFPLGVPNGVEDIDDFIRQKISGGLLSRVGINMRDLVRKQLDEATHHFLAKEKKLLASGASKIPSLEKWDDGYQISQKIIIGLMECIRKTGGAAQEGDPSLVSSAVSAIVSNVGPAVTKLNDFTGSFNTVRRIIRVLVTCLSSLKDALGERQSRVFEIALATEASSALSAVLAPGKTAAFDASSNTSNEILNTSAKTGPGKCTKIAAAVSALIVGATIQGIISLERVVSALRVKEGLDVIQFIRSSISSANGNSRTSGTVKMENSVETYVHWFRLLIGNCRTLCDGLISELLGEPVVVSLCRMQRTLPISLIFPPAYSIFAFLTWKSFILNNLANREDIHQLCVSLTSAVSDAIHHLPFRDACFRDTRGLYDLAVADSCDAELAAIMELNDPNSQLKTVGVIPLRARLFLNALIECKIPAQDEGVRSFSGHVDLKERYTENNTKLLDKLVHVLDTLQPAKFHWQWVELRLLLNEQALIEKFIAHDISFADALRTLSSNTDKATASENENNFIELILTRLLVRPDAAPLFSEVVHLFGRSLDDSMLLQAKWFLGGQDVLFGRKSIRQRLINIAEGKGLSTKPQFHKPWGWATCNADYASSEGNKRKQEASSLEEGEVAEGLQQNRLSKASRMVNFENLDTSQRLVTESAFTGLVLPCIDQSSDDSRNTFATDLIKQLNNIEQQIAAVTRGTSKQSSLVSSGFDGATNKGNSRKGIRGGSPGLARRTTVQSESLPISPSALRASMSLRLHFILRLLPFIWSEGDRDSRNMRHMLASVIIRLLGSPVVYEDADLLHPPTQSFVVRRDKESRIESPTTTASAENVFDRLLLVLHGLLSSYKPSWLKSKAMPKSSNEHAKDVSVFDREVVENLQNDLERMQLPNSIKRRIQSAMPVLISNPRCSISCQPPTVPVSAITELQLSTSNSSLSQGNSNQPHKNTTNKVPANTPGKAKASLLQPEQHDIEIDPWQLLEDGACFGSSNIDSAAGTSDSSTKALSWLKGAIRVRRTDLTYIGAVDDDS